MARRMFCNGCGNEVQEGPQNSADQELGIRRFQCVQVRVAAISGTGQPFGIASECVIEGDLCASCIAALREFVGDGETSAAARGFIEGRALAAV